MDDFLMHEHSDEWNKQARLEEQWEEYQKWTREMDEQAHLPPTYGDGGIQGLSLCRGLDQWHYLDQYPRSRSWIYGFHRG